MQCMGRTWSLRTSSKPNSLLLTELPEGNMPIVHLPRGSKYETADRVNLKSYTLEASVMAESPSSNNPQPGKHCPSLLRPLSKTTDKPYQDWGSSGHIQRSHLILKLRTLAADRGRGSLWLQIQALKFCLSPLLDLAPSALPLFSAFHTQLAQVSTSVLLIAEDPFFRQLVFHMHCIWSLVTYGNTGLKSPVGGRAPRREKLQPLSTCEDLVICIQH